MPTLAQIEATKKRVKEVFQLFEFEVKERKGKADERDVPIMVRALGLNPRPEQVAALKNEMKGGEDNASAFVEYERFDEVMVRTLLEHARDYRRDTEERILRAFRAFDADDRGYLEVDALRHLLTQRGDAFVQQEIDNLVMMAGREGFIQQGKFYYEGYADLVAKDGVVDKWPPGAK